MSPVPKPTLNSSAPVTKPTLHPSVASAFSVAALATLTEVGSVHITDDEHRDVVTSLQLLDGVHEVPHDLGGAFHWTVEGTPACIAYEYGEAEGVWWIFPAPQSVEA